MTPDAPHGALRCIGRPVRLVRARADLTAEEVAARLRDPQLPQTLDRLGITEPDRSELLDLIPVALDDPAAREAITRTTARLRREAGLTAEVADIDHRKQELNAAQRAVTPGQGLVATLAHVAALDTVRRWHAERGVSEDDSWRALSDLGQQLRVHRRVFGELGHHTLAFTAKNWAGRLLSIGRLQYELVRRPSPSMGPHWLLDVHVPATGPLEPAAVDASLDAAASFFAESFSDLDADRPPERPRIGHELTCRSWLLGPEIRRVLGDGTRLGSFAARWTVEEEFEATRDVEFFVFGRRGGVAAPAALPGHTRLERAMRARLMRGEGWTGATGRIFR